MFLLVFGLFRRFTELKQLGASDQDRSSFLGRVCLWLLLPLLILPSTGHKLVAVQEIVCMFRWPNRGSVATSEMQVHKCISIPAAFWESLFEETKMSGFRDTQRREREKGSSWFRKPIWLGKWFHFKGKILPALILQQVGVGAGMGWTLQNWRMVDGGGNKVVPRFCLAHCSVLLLLFPQTNCFSCETLKVRIEWTKKKCSALSGLAIFLLVRELALAGLFWRHLCCSVLLWRRDAVCPPSPPHSSRMYTSPWAVFDCCVIYVCLELCSRQCGEKNPWRTGPC